MMKKDVIFFDLDGTLTDSQEGIVRSVIHALQTLGRSVPDEHALHSFIGPPLKDSFHVVCGLDEETTLQAVEIYRARYAATGLFENRVYDGVEEMLGALKGAGCTLGVATSKPEQYSEKILNHFGLIKYFDFMYGATLDHKRVTKTDVIAHALQSSGFDTQRERVVMVGDRQHDMEGARANGIFALGILYGYGSRAELEAAGADLICTDTAAVLRFLLRHLA